MRSFTATLPAVKQWEHIREYVQTLTNWWPIQNCTWAPAANERWNIRLQKSNRGWIPNSVNCVIPNRLITCDAKLVQLKYYTGASLRRWRIAHAWFSTSVDSPPKWREREREVENIWITAYSPPFQISDRIKNNLFGWKTNARSRLCLSNQTSIKIIASNWRIWPR